MARQVNTRFVVILVSALAGLSALVIGVYFMHNMPFLRNWLQRDPHQLIAQGEQALKSGNRDAAIDYFNRAVPQALRTHMPETERLFLRIGDLNYELSSDAGHYGNALEAWQKARLMNPKFKDAQERLLRERYIHATRLTSDWWPTVEKLAARLIELDPTNGEGYVDHAEAILKQASKDEGLSEDRQAIAESDLQQAMKQMANDVRAYSLLMELNLYRAEMAEHRGKKNDLDKARLLRDNARKLIGDFCAKHPTDPVAYAALVDLHAQLKEMEEAQRALETAKKVDPNSVKVYEASERLHRMLRKYSDLAADLKKLSDLQPDDLQLYVQLGSNYEDNLGDPVNALEAFKQVFSRKPQVIGCTMICNDQARSSTLFYLPWCYLDAAEVEGPATPKGKADLTEAANKTEKVRDKYGMNHPLVDLLDGRNSFLKNELQQAVPALRRADDGLPNVSHLLSLRCKLLLADAYTQQTEYGTAMKYINDVLQQSPGMYQAIQRKIRLLLHVARYDEALKAADEVLKIAPNEPRTLQLKANALAGLGDYVGSEQILKMLKETKDGGPDVLSSSLQLAQMQLFRNEPDEVVVTLVPVLGKYPDNDKALLLMSIALIKLDRKPEARSYLEKGLAKYPDNVQLQLLVKTLDHPDIPLKTLQIEIIKNIADAFERNWAMAQFYSGQNDIANELKWLHECEKVKNDSDIVIDRIFSLALHQQDWPLAEQYAQRAANLNLDSVSGRLFQGRLEYARGDKARGIETLRSAVAQRDDYSMGWTTLGQAYADMQNTTEAITALERAVAEKPDNIYALKTLIYLYIKQGDDSSIRMAKNYLTTALRFAPRDQQLRVFDDEIGSPKDAIKNRETLRAIDPKNGENLRRLAVLYTRDNQIEKAVATLQDLQGQQPKDLTVADALARLYRDQGHTNEALKMYEPFLIDNDVEMQFRARVLLGDMHRSMAQVDEAIAFYKDAAHLEKAGNLEAERRLADMYFEMEDMPRAEAIYQKVYRDDTNKDVRVLRRYIETLIRQDKFALATDLLDTQVLKDRPNDAEGLVLRGYALLRQHKAREAMDSFDKVLETNQDNTDALHYRAFTNFTLNNNHAAAINDLLHVRSLAPNAINSRLLLARVYYADKQFPESAHEYQEVLALRPDILAARTEYAEVLLNLAQLYVHLTPGSEDTLSLRIRAVKPVEMLAALLTDSMRRYPKQSAWPIMLGNLYGMTGNGDDAVTIHKAAFVDSGKNLQIGMTYINTLMNVHRYQEALSVSDDLLQINSTVELYVRHGAANAALGHVDLATDDFVHAVDMTHDVTVMPALARQCFMALGAQNATNLFRKRLDKNPKDYQARLALGMVASAKEDNPSVIAMLTPLLSDPQAESAKTIVLRMLAMANYQIKAFEQSLNYYQQLLQIAPDDLEALNNIAYLVADDLKRPEDGLKYAQHAREIIDNRPVESSLASYSNVMDTVGWVKFLADDVEGASDDLQRSLQMDPLPICYYHLAKLYQKQHRLMDAKDAAEKSVKLGASRKDPIVPMAKALLVQLKIAPPV